MDGDEDAVQKDIESFKCRCGMVTAGSEEASSSLQGGRIKDDHDHPLRVHGCMCFNFPAGINCYQPLGLLALNYGILCVIWHMIIIVSELL